MAHEYNASDPRQVRLQNKANRRRARESRDHWRSVLNSQAGAHVVQEILIYSGVFSCPQGQGDALQQEFGKQFIGYHILEKIADADPAALPKILANATPFAQNAQARRNQEEIAERRDLAEEKSEQEG